MVNQSRYPPKDTSISLFHNEKKKAMAALHFLEPPYWTNMPHRNQIEKKEDNTWDT